MAGDFSVRAYLLDEGLRGDRVECWERERGVSEEGALIALHIMNICLLNSFRE